MVSGLFKISTFYSDKKYIECQIWNSYLLSENKSVICSKLKIYSSKL